MRDYSCAGLRVNVGQLKPGDCVEQIEGAPFGTATVKYATDKKVVLFRPYAADAGFVYGDGQIITYTGIEETEFLLPSRADFKLYYRQVYADTLVKK